MPSWIPVAAALVLAVGCSTAPAPVETPKTAAAGKPSATLPVCDLVADNINIVAFRDGSSAGVAEGAPKPVPVDQIRVGDKVLFNHSVFNGGPAAAIPADAAFAVDFLLDGQYLIGDPQASAIDANRYITYTVRGWHWIAEKPGRHACQLVVRPGTTINDPNPDNNTLDCEFDVKP